MSKLIINIELASELLEVVQEQLLKDKKNYKIPLEDYFIKFTELDVDLIEVESNKYSVAKINRSEENE